MRMKVDQVEENEATGIREFSEERMRRFLEERDIVVLYGLISQGGGPRNTWNFIKKWAGFWEIEIPVNFQAVFKEAAKKYRQCQ